MNIKTDIEQKNYVEVNDEPLHVELFRNKYIRLYNASLSPGAATMFHRHCEDTIYIVHEGGVISTEIFPGSEKSPASFPKSFGLFQKALMGIRLVTTGSIRLPKSLFFSILSKDQPIVHRAVASAKNTKNMELMGVEILCENRQSKYITLKDSCYKVEYENDKYSVLKLLLKPGQSKNVVYDFPGVIISLNGKAEFKDVDSKESTYDVLESRDFSWYEGTVTQALVNKGRENFEAIIIVLK